MGHYTEMDLISKSNPQKVSPMQVFLNLQLEANIPKDRANANEIFSEIKHISKIEKEKIALAAIKAYEETISDNSWYDNKENIPES